jgi:hypothetical protein
VAGSKLSAHVALNAATTSLSGVINSKAAAKGGSPTSIVHAVHLLPAPSKGARGLLWQLLQTRVANRAAILVAIANNLRKSVPKAMAKHPLRLANLGFQTFDQLVTYLVAGISAMETGAKTLAEFNKGIEGWRWNVAGRLLFERLVKFDPHLDKFFRGVASDLFAEIKSHAGKTFVTLIDGRGNTRRVDPAFGPVEKVLEFKLRGADDVVRAYTDFAFMANNGKGIWAALLIEIKMPAALSGVAEQFSEFLPRLKEAKELIAVIEDSNGVKREVNIRPEDFTLLEHERGQIAVAPNTVRQGKAIEKAGPIAPSAVGKVLDFAPAPSERHELIYYKVRVLVIRDWLVDIVKAMTD